MWAILVVILLTILFLISASCSPGTYVLGYEVVPPDSSYGLEGLYAIYGEDSTRHLFAQVQEGDSFCFVHMAYETIERRQ